MWGEFQLPPYIGGAVKGAVGALALPKAPLRRVGGVIRCALGASLKAIFSPQLPNYDFDIFNSQVPNEFRKFVSI